MASDIERIQAYITGDDEQMTPHLEKKYRRIMQLCALIIEHMDDTESIAIYVSLTGVDQSQAYRDLADARKLAGDIISVDRKFEFLRMYHKQKKSIDIAEAAGKHNAVMSGHRNAILYLEKINEGEMIDLTKYKPHTVILTYNPELLGDTDLPDEDTLKGIVEKLSTPKISLDTNDYSEYEDISEELRRSDPNAP